jgi:hypothetical protein
VEQQALEVLNVMWCVSGAEFYFRFRRINRVAAEFASRDKCQVARNP